MMPGAAAPSAPGSDGSPAATADGAAASPAAWAPARRLGPDGTSLQAAVPAAASAALRSQDSDLNAAAVAINTALNSAAARSLPAAASPTVSSSSKFSANAAGAKSMVGASVFEKQAAGTAAVPQAAKVAQAGRPLQQQEEEEQQQRRQQQRRQSDTASTEGNTELHTAAVLSDVARVKQLLASGADINARNEALCTPLHLAAAIGHVPTVEALLSHTNKDGQYPVLINAMDKEAQTPLVAAVHAGCLEVVDLLVRQHPENMHYKLHFAAQHGYLSLLKELLDGGAPVNLPDENNWTPLHRACLHGHWNVAAELATARKADILAGTKCGRTPVLCATEGGNPLIVKLLLEAAAGLPQDYKSKDGWSTNLLQHKTRHAGNPDEPGLNVLLLAAKHGHAEVVKEIAPRASCNLAACDHRGRTALHHACLGGTPGHLAVVKELIARYGAQFKDVLDDEGRTPLIMAIKHHDYCKEKLCKHSEMATALQQAGANKHFALHHAAHTNDLATLRDELDGGCVCEKCKLQEEKPVLLTDSKNWSALHVAAERGHVEAAAELIKAGGEAVVNAASNDGVTPLIVAAKCGQADVVKLLIDSGAQIWAKTTDGRTVLHKACNRKAKPTHPGRNRRTPQAHSGHVECVRHLLAAAAELRTSPVYVPEAKLKTASTMGLTMCGNTMATVTMGGTPVGKDTKVDDAYVVNAKDSKGFTAVAMAAYNSNHDIVRLLLKDGRADILASDANGYIPLHNASSRGNIGIVKSLVAAGSPVRPTNNEGCTPLHYAARGGHANIVKYLLAARVRAVDDNEESLVDVPNTKKVTPLFLAAERGCLDVVNLLLEQGANPMVVDAGGNTALHMAAQKCQLEVVRRLLESMAEKDKQEQEKQIALDGRMLMIPVHACKQNMAGMTALHLAIDSDPKKEGRGDDRCLEVAQVLLESAKDDMQQLINSTNKLSMTALRLAVERERTKLVDYLLEKGANLTLKDKNDATVLHAAASGGNINILKLLLRAQGNAMLHRQKDWQGNTALHVALANDCLEAAKEIAETDKPKDNEGSLNATDIDCMRITNNQGWFPIHVAARAGNVLLLKLLEEEYEQDVENMTTSGRTPLHVAAAFGQVDVVTYLLAEKQVDMNVVFKPPIVKENIKEKKKGSRNSKTPHWARDSNRCLVHEEYRLICPVAEKDPEKEVVPACVSTSLGPAKGYSYFELTVVEVEPLKDSKDRPIKPVIYIGGGVDKAAYDVPPGLKENTFSYCSSNGYVYMGTVSSARQYSAKWGQGDTVGVLFNRTFRSVSFVKNGVHLGIAIRSHEVDVNFAEGLCAMVGWKTLGIKQLRINFGLDEDIPFVANVDDLIQEEEALQNPGDLQPFRFKDCMHPMHFACCAKSEAVLRKLLEHAVGPVLWQKDADMWTSLHFCALVGWDKGMLVLYEHFVAMRAKQAAAGGAAPAVPGAPAAGAAAACGGGSSAGAGASGKAGGKTAAQGGKDSKTDKPEEGGAMAPSNAPTKVAKAAQDAGYANFVDAKTKYGNSPLVLAIKGSHTEAAKFLIDRGANCTITDRQGRTLLMHAAATGNVEIMSDLIKKGVAVKTKDNIGRTAMQYASNAASATFLETQGNEAIEYEGHVHLRLRVDTEVKRGAVGEVVMARSAATNDPLAIKFHSTAISRNQSYTILQQLGQNKEARQYICCIPAEMTEEQVKFDDFENHRTHPYALVIQGGDQTLQDILEELGPPNPNPFSSSKGAPTTIPMPLNHCRFIFWSLATAVSILHNNGWVHHDVKARNFVRNFNGTYMLIDFDNAKQAGKEDMGFTSAEICPPEVAHAVPSVDQWSKHHLASAKSMDVWALGCVLYQMVTHRLLLIDVAIGWSQHPAQKYDNDQALEVWRCVTDEKIARSLDTVKDAKTNPVVKLLKGMLTVNPTNRYTIQDVMGSSFLNGDDTMGHIAGELKHLNTKMDIVVAGVGDIRDRMVKLESLPEQLRQGFADVSKNISSFRKMVLQVHKKGCPTTFVIGPEIPLEQTMAAKGTDTSKLSGWASGLGDVFTGKMSLEGFAQELTFEKFRLKLVCEKCGNPQGEGYAVKQPKKWVADMLPAMKVSLAVAKVANVGLSVAKAFFPAMPTIPDNVMDMGKQALDFLNHKSSAEDFGCIQDTLDEKGTDGNAFKKQLDAGLRQLAAFLATADPTNTWAGLALIDLDADSNNSSSSSSSSSSTSSGGGLSKGGKKSVHVEGDEEPPAAEQQMPESVLWVCKGCLTGTCSSDSSSGSNSSSGAGSAATGSASGAGGKGEGTGAHSLVTKLQAKVTQQEQEIALLRKELQQAGLPLPKALAAGAAGAAAAAAGAKGAGGSASKLAGGAGSPVPRSSPRSSGGGCFGSKRGAVVYPEPGEE